MKTGWININTGEIGKFDANNKPIKYSFWDKLKFFINRNRLINLENGLQNYKEKSFNYVKTVTYNKYFNGVWIGQTDYSIYINHFTKKAKTGCNKYLDYNALIADDKIVFLN